MPDFSFSVDDAHMILKALDALRDLAPPQYLDDQIVSLQLRVSNGFPHFHSGEIRNICLGLEYLLRENPLDWKAETLLHRLRAMLHDHT